MPCVLFLKGDIKMGKNIRKRNLKLNRAIKITAAIIVWFAVFLLINLITKRNQASGLSADVTETYVILAVSAIISLLGFVATLYAVFYFERFSLQRRKKKQK